jgi:hypothetical protein
MISRNIPIRLEEDVIAEIDNAAALMGVHRSGFIKMAVALQMEELKAGAVNVRNAAARMLPRSEFSVRLKKAVAV